jgi:endo-1,4-beta-xylanase
MRSHIEALAGRYRGRVRAWDVVNEVIDDDGSYRPTSWVQGIGDGDALVRMAFTFAQRYAPDTELYYNDFNAWRPEKRDGIVRMVRMLQAAGIRIDGVGMQGHWGLNFPDKAHIEAAIDAYAALGVKVMITELDVDVLPLTREGQIIGTGMLHKQFQLPEFKRFLDPYSSGLPEPVQRQLADRYAELFAIFHRKRDRIDRVTLWGVHDGMSWKNGYPIPNRANYPLLFDRQRQPKPALEAVLDIPLKASANQVLDR